MIMYVKVMAVRKEHILLAVAPRHVVVSSDGPQEISSTCPIAPGRPEQPELVGHVDRRGMLPLTSGIEGLEVPGVQLRPHFCGAPNSAAEILLGL